MTKMRRIKGNSHFFNDFFLLSCAYDTLRCIAIGYILLSTHHRHSIINSILYKSEYPSSMTRKLLAPSDAMTELCHLHENQR